MRLPMPGEQVPVQLLVETQEGRERWTRQFGSSCLVTSQWLQEDLLIEAAGPIRFGFRMTADTTGMEFHFARCWLFGLPLPYALSPRVNAIVRGTEAGWRVQVRVEVPVLGQLSQYEGEIRLLN
jgi:hypothetical protein